jgi:hypothetical protein
MFKEQTMESSCSDFDSIHFYLLLNNSSFLFNQNIMITSSGNPAGN